MPGEHNKCDKKPRREELSDEQWQLIEPLLPKPVKVRGRPRRDEREVWNGILMIKTIGGAFGDFVGRSKVETTGAFGLQRCDSLRCR